MSSSSDIEKLFDHFGGDANAYQEIGRENEARSARTRWPLLVTLDLTQPTIPAIGPRREARPQTSDATPAVEPTDSTPKDAASVTRARAPLFTRSHRRDIPPVAVAAQPAAPSGASRFGAPDTVDGAAAQPASSAVRNDAPAPVSASAQAAPVAAPVTAASQAAPLATPARVAPLAAVPPAVSAAPVMPVASVPPAIQFRAPAMQAIPPARAAAPNWAQAAAPAASWPQAPAQPPAQAPATALARAYATAPAVPAPPASILGKLFAPEPQTASPQAVAPPAEAAPLQSVFDRLRGTPAQTAATPAGASRAAAPAPSNSWLVNGPRRS